MSSTAEDPEYKLRIYRTRVAEFEREFTNKLKGLLEYEKAYADLKVSRTGWLMNTSGSYELDAEIFQKKLDVFKKNMYLLKVQLESEMLALEDVKNAHILRYLIEATKTIEKGETLELRKMKLDMVLRDNTELWKEAMMDSIRRRSAIYARVAELHDDADRVQVEFESNSQHYFQILNEKCAIHIKRLNEGSEVLRTNSKKITADYLVLRHNARVAKEALIRRKNETNKARTDLREKLDMITEEVEKEKIKMEKTADAQIRVRSDESRKEIEQKEVELEKIKARVRREKAMRKDTKHDLLMALSMYKEQYKDLQMKRRFEIEVMGGELTKLREAVKELELVYYSSDWATSKKVTPEMKQQNDLVTQLQTKLKQYNSLSNRMNVLSTRDRRDQIA